jgi:hypothetical protein
MSRAAELGGTNYILNLPRGAISNVSHSARSSLPSLHLTHDNVNRSTPVTGPDPGRSGHGSLGPILLQKSASGGLGATIESERASHCINIAYQRLILNQCC